jgi:hypothetical protein
MSRDPATKMSLEKFSFQSQSSRRLGGFAPSFLFHVGRTAVPHLAMELVSAFMRTINGCSGKPVRIGQVTPSVVRVERVAAMNAGLDLRLGSHIVRLRAMGPKWRAIQSKSAERRFFVRTRVTHPGITSSRSELITWSSMSGAVAARTGGSALRRRRTAGINSAVMAFG